MIEINKYYQVPTSEGIRTVQAQQQVAVGVFHGIYSRSNYEDLGDNEDIQIPADSPESSQEQIDAYVNWYGNS